MMSTPKYVSFFNQLTNTVNSLDTLDAKLSIGDSINNNRTLTVGQVIRYLTESSSRKNVRLGKSLESVYEILKDDIRDFRFNNRTDALDINEFINFYNEVVIGCGEYNHIIGRTVNLSA
jgi:hypothetical protein